MSGPGARRLTGRQVLWIVLVGFGLVFAANGAMAWLALATFPGLVSDHAYREGLEYNRTLAARAAQAARGWRSDVRVTGTGTSRRVVAAFRDREGSPIAGMRVTARLVRPVVAGFDRSVSLAEAAPGTYRGTVSLPALGDWRLKIDATRPAFRSRPEQRWHMERTLWLK